MGYYKVLSTPLSYCLENYKGFYRIEPFPKSDENSRFMALWQQYAHDGFGITTELTLEELKEFAQLSTVELGENFEVAYFSETENCPHPAQYYGADVAGGWYSMLASNLFTDSDNQGLWSVLNQHFRPKLNQNSLFEETAAARSFCKTLKDLVELNPVYMEPADWRVWHVFQVG